MMSTNRSTRLLLPVSPRRADNHGHAEPASGEQHRFEVLDLPRKGTRRDIGA